MDLPEHFGSWKGAHNRLRKWAADGTWEKVFTASARPGRRRRRPRLGRRGRLDHRPCPPARRRGPSKGAPAGEPDDHAPRTVPGRTDHQDPPRRRQQLSPAGLRHHARPGRRRTRVHPGHDRLRVPRRTGRPRITPDMVLADNAYSSRAIRSHLRRRGIRAVIPQPADQASNRKRLGRRGGRPPAFDRDAYKQRNTVERCRRCPTRPWPASRAGLAECNRGRQHGRSSPDCCPASNTTTAGSSPKSPAIPAPARSRRSCETHAETPTRHPTKPAPPCWTTLSLGRSIPSTPTRLHSSTRLPGDARPPWSPGGPA